MFVSSRTHLLPSGYFSQHHVDTLNATMSPVQFLASKFPGKTEQEYRGHLGNFQISGMTGYVNLSWFPCSVSRKLQAPAYWYTFWWSEVSCRLCRPIAAKSSHIAVGRGEYIVNFMNTPDDFNQPTNHLDIEV